VLLAKLEVFDAELIARSEAAARYAALLRDVLQAPQVMPDRTCVWAQYTVEVEDRDMVQQIMTQQGIPTAVHYPVPLHLQPALASLHLPAGAFPVAERAAQRVLSLPMHPYLAPSDTLAIVSALKTALAQPAAR